jgi:arsenate reductase
MAEGWARHFAAKLISPLQLDVRSAGIEAHGLNPRAVAAMQKQGVDISAHSSDVLTNDMIDWAELIVTVCGDAQDNCPLLPARLKKRHLGFPDPAKATGSDAEIEKQFDDVCRQIRDTVLKLLTELTNDLV